MKSRIRILFAVIIFSLLGFVVFCNTIDAATIFTDNFNSYTDGSLRGQGSWITNSAYVQVEDYNVLEGSKAFKIYEPFPGSFFAEKSGTSVNDGLITIYMKRIIGGTTSPQVEVQLKEGDNIAVSMKSISGFFRYFNGVSNSYSIFGPFFASNIWYALQIQWRSSDHAIRYNIDGGIWTNWTIGVADWATGLDTMRIIVADGVTFFDAIQENLITTEAKNPVLIVPGLLGTEMKKGDELLWADITRMINPLNSDNFMDPLVFSKDLTPADSGVYKNNVIKNPNNLYDYTDGLINEFENQGYIENEDIFTFPAKLGALYIRSGLFIFSAISK